MREHDWRHRAACRDADPENFFPAAEDRTASPAVAAQIDAAAAVCSGCPVRTACLAWAVDTRQDFGVWGGLTSPERRTLIRARAGTTS